MTTSTQLSVAVAPGMAKPFEVIGPDGTSSPLTIPADSVFVITDISMQRLTVVGTSGLFEFAIQQALGDDGLANRWTYIGKTRQNVERTFNSGIAFSTVPSVENGSQSVDTVAIRAWGYFAAKT